MEGTFGGNGAFFDEVSKDSVGGVGISNVQGEEIQQQIQGRVLDAARVGL